MVGPPEKEAILASIRDLMAGWNDEMNERLAELRDKLKAQGVADVDELVAQASADVMEGKTDGRLERD